MSLFEPVLGSGLWFCKRPRLLVLGTVHVGILQASKVSLLWCTRLRAPMLKYENLRVSSNASSAN